MVESIVVLNPLQNLQISTDKPVSGVRNRFLHIRKTGGRRSPRPCNPLFLVVLVHLNTAKDQNNVISTP